MGIFPFILNISFSLVMVFTPWLGLSFEINHEQMEMNSCCAVPLNENAEQPMSCDSTETKHSKEKTSPQNCHSSDKTDHNSCNDKCKENCNDHACRVINPTVQMPEFDEKIQVEFTLSNTKQLIYYQYLTIQNVTYNFWNPPKLI